MSSHSGSAAPRASRGRGRGQGRGRQVPSRSTEGPPVNQWSQGNKRWAETKTPGKQGRQDAAKQQQASKPKLSDEERFRDASSVIQKSVQRHLENEEGELNSSSEDEMDDDNILQSTFQLYSSPKDESGEDLDRATQYLVDALRSGANVCLVCIEKIKRLDAIWSCSQCYCVLHLACVQKWAKEGALHRHLMEDGATKNTKNALWSCPKCRHESLSTAIPKRYTCYCGKVVDPPFHPWLAPHSCGERCERPLRPACGHKCLLLCHPGPCPPCPKMVRSACHCGRQAPQARRCSAKTWSCGQACSKMLSCGQHKCQQPCHAGACNACPRSSLQQCMCRKKTATRQCATPQWHCESVCDKPLPCGHHTCQQTCHAGDCGNCPRAGKRECPCGKTSFELPCTENIPTCGDTCDKLMECKLHKCTRRCHAGPCETCRQFSIKTCRCGQKEKSILCCKEFLCDLKCQKMRDCQRHQCKRKCCDGSCPLCEQPCGRQLPCKNHKCPSTCHPGLCYPCQETVSIKCSCGSTTITVPCGRERVTKPPKCNKPCRIPPDCHHAQRDPHRCHFQRCPPCQQACNQPLSSCSHRCPWQCHSAVLVTQVENKGVRMAPWEPKPQAHLTLQEKPCPPCQVPIPTECLGKHETHDLPCAFVRPFSCNKQCGQLLPCSNHRCTLECHIVTAEGHQSGRQCGSCDARCSKPRPAGCSHPCLKPCHSGPCPPCTQSIRQRCHCKMMVLHIECCKWTSANTDESSTMSSCQGPCTKQLACSHLCSKSCHPGECSRTEDCTQKVAVRCPCKRRKKDFPCCELKTGNAKVDCVAACKQAMEKQEREKEAEKVKKEEENKARQQRDLEEYERLTKGKKRRERRKKDDIVQLSFLQRNRKAICMVAAAIVISAILAYFVYLA